MKIFREISALRAEIRAKKKLGWCIGFVPTMGALHEGHMALARKAVAENDLVLASIFVNPTQFDNPSDLEHYPRSFEQDCAMLRAEGVNYIFAPEVLEIYPEPMETTVDVLKLSAGLIGKIRPGHFQGVATVVCKLLNIAGADRAYFGEKDFQQLAIIRRMVFDLNFPTEIIAVPTQRDHDGLALSSRNRRLSNEDRNAASVIYRAIQKAVGLLDDGEREVAKIKAVAEALIASDPRARLLSVDIVDAQSLEEISQIKKPAALLLNVAFGDIILIDQAVLTP